jgi:4-amino-4-deoxy-L-arabinose transferase
LLLGFWLLAYILPLGWRPLVQPDEIRYGEIAREMLSSGDWIVPRLSGLRYFENPPLAHWLNAASLAVFGENAFGVRFASSLSIGLMGAAIWRFTQRYSGSRNAGLIAGVVFLSSPGAMAVGNYALLDGITSLWITLALMSFYHAIHAPSAKVSARYSALLGLMCGLAFLTRGLTAMLMPLAVIVPFMLWEKRGRELLRYGPIALAAAILVALPWSWQIYQLEPDFWRHFFWVEYGQYYSGAEAGDPFWFFLPIVLVATFPWLPLMVGRPWQALRDSRSPHIRLLIRFCLCWSVLGLVYFSLPLGKSSMFVLACMPAMAILLGIGASRLIADGQEILFNNALQFCRFILVLLLLAAVLNFTAGIGSAAWRVHETVEWVWFCGVLVAWISLLRLAIASSLAARHWIIGLGTVPMFALIPLYLPELVYAGKMPGKFIEEQATTISDDTIITADATLMASASWYFKRTDIYMVGSMKEYQYGLSYPDSIGRHIDQGDFQQFINNSARPVAYFDKFGSRPPVDLPVGASEGVMGRFILFRLYPAGQTTPAGSNGPGG